LILKTETMSKKKTIKVAIILTALILIPALLFVIFKAQYESALKVPNSSSTETVEFEIMEGESIDTIIPSLIAQDLLKEEHKNFFLIYLKTNNLIPTIQAGFFNIPKNLNMKELAETLQTAGVPSDWVTIPEGLRADEIAQKVSDVFMNVNENEFMNLVQDQAFINSFELHGENITSLEGFLFPDKYLMQREIEAREVISIMVENFKNKVPKDYNYDDIILASLIEREGINPEDRKIISGVLQKRLDEQWLLQVDATLLYHKKDWNHIITVQDKDEAQPYNSYMYHGLPPTPICNPGLDSIQSVFEPESTEYYYYIHYKNEDGDLVPGYSETLGEHEAKVQRYLR
jgi:UPF0755 protein